MRTKPFTFKKTKRVKQVVQHRGLTVDLTEQDCADLAELVGSVYGVSKARDDLFDPLWDRLRMFLNAVDNPPKPRSYISTNPIMTDPE